MPAEVIDRVHVLARRTVGAGAAGLAFTDRIGNPFIDPANDDSSNNETYTPDTSDMDDNYDSDDDDTDSEQVNMSKKGGKQILYVDLKKALYGTLQAALLFWKKLTSQLETWGFIINPYGSCVMNKMINDNQCTILWHVDDLKISHVEHEVVSAIIKQLEATFGLEAPLTKTRGKIHDYLGMIIDFSKKGKVKISMKGYIVRILADLLPEMDGDAAPPLASNHLFKVNELDSIKLNTEEAVLFHHTVARPLFLCKRAWPKIQTAVAFLCTRVKCPDEDDYYKKLCLVMKYLQGTINMQLTLETDNVKIVKWWVDASFAVHPDMKSHTGGRAMTLGKGITYGTSTRQKI